jgi:hypothetical protein
MAIRFGKTSTVKNRLPRYSNFWDGTAVYSPWNNTGSYDALASYTVGSGGISSITFSGITNEYSHLQIRGIARTDRATYNSDPLKLTFNSDGGSNYARHFLLGDGGSASADGVSSQTFIQNYLITTNVATSGVFAAFVIDILDYASTTKNKTTRALMGFDNNGSGYVGLNSGLWMNSSTAINSLTLAGQFGTFQQYSQFSLYGVK